MILSRSRYVALGLMLASWIIAALVPELTFYGFWAGILFMMLAFWGS